MHRSSAARGHGAATGGSGKEAFFSALPPDELTPLENGLRQVLLDWLSSLGHGGTFHLTEWIDRRVGGEIETRRDDKGHFELVLRGGAVPPPGRPQHVANPYDVPPGNFGRMPPPAPGMYGGPPHGYPPAHHPPAPGPPPPAPPSAPSKRKEAGSDAAAFFKSLPSDSFSRQEEELRDAIFDFLASWKSQALANLNDLTKDANCAKCARFVPKEVELGDWIEKRIGLEIQLQKDAVGGPHPIIHLSKGAQGIVADKYKKIEAKNGAGRPGSSGPGEKNAPVSKASGAKPPVAKPVAAVPDAGKEDFFATLPDSELLPAELELRDAVLAFVNSWPGNRRDKPRDSVPVLADLGQDAKIQRCRSACMPSKVSLKDWIDRRIGGEIEVTKDSKGQLEITLRGAPKRARGADRPQGNDRGQNAGDRGGNGRGAAAPVDPEAFLAGLAEDSLSDAEADLRLVVLGIVEARGDRPISLGDASKDPNLLRSQNALLPPEVSLRSWITRRIGGEVKIEKDSKGQWMMSSPSSDPGPAAQNQGDKKEQFFATLPDDCFLPEEEDLRDTLLAFLGQWTGGDAPTLSDAGGDAEIRRARPLVLHKGCQVSLKDWIERRIGGEIEMAMDPRGSGQWLFGLRGALEVPTAGGAARGGPPPAAKRQRR